MGSKRSRMKRARMLSVLLTSVLLLSSAAAARHLAAEDETSWRVHPSHEHWHHEHNETRQSANSRPEDAGERGRPEAEPAEFGGPAPPQAPPKGGGEGAGGLWRDCSDPSWGCPDGVWWTKRQVGRAMQNANFLQAEALLAKLRRGEAITVAALGSSITAWKGGSYHRSVAALASKVGQIPSRYLEFSFPQHRAGWLAEVMRAINRTFPHPDHTLVVNAQSAWSLKRWARAACLENTLPRSIDLLVLENVDEGAPLLDVDWLIQRVYNHLQQHRQCHPPAVLFLHTNLLAVEMHNKAKVQRIVHPGSGFPWDDHLCPEREGERERQIHIVGKHMFRGMGAEVMTEEQWNGLLQYYGFASVAERNFWYPLLREGEAARRGLTACGLLRTVSWDGIHPGVRDPSLLQAATCPGYQLFADFVLHYLDEAAHYLARTAPAGPAAGGGECPAWAGPVHGGEEFERRGWQPRMQQRCYGIDDAVTRHLGEASSAFRLHGRAYQRDLLDYFTNANLTKLKVVRNEGWAFAMHSRHGGERKVKPGWVANSSGAELHVEVDSVFAALPDTNVSMSVEYLQSYEHMGRARISCVSGCACEALEVDALHPAEEISVTRPAPLAVTQHDRCVVSIRVLEETSSGEHEFKVVMVVLDSGTMAHHYLKLDE